MTVTRGHRARHLPHGYRTAHTDTVDRVTATRATPWGWATPRARVGSGVRRPTPPRGPRQPPLAVYSSPHSRCHRTPLDLTRLAQSYRLSRYSHSMTAHDHVRASMDSRQPQPHADACATRVFEARVARTARPPTQAPLEGDEVWRRGLAFDEGAVEVGEVAHAAHGRSRPYLARARREHRLGVPKGRPLRLRQDG